ncbi:hypothetical protein PINS_up008733 [Pythium insidiosum]|nr:hypothetical protein PINS_up008733 [Pythium insidiosum]
MGRGEYYRNKYGRGGGRGGRGRGGGDARDEDYAPRRRRGQSPADSQRERPLRSWQQLATLLRDLDNRNYPAYHDLEHAIYVHDDATSGSTFMLGFDHIQGDPFASPSRAHVTVSPRAAQFPREMFASKIRNIALCDYLTRQFADSARRAGADAKTRT